jgi:hypothetical protein
MAPSSTTAVPPATGPPAAIEGTAPSRSMSFASTSMRTGVPGAVTARSATAMASTSMA